MRTTVAATWSVVILLGCVPNSEPTRRSAESSTAREQSDVERAPTDKEQEREPQLKLVPGTQRLALIDAESFPGTQRKAVMLKLPNGNLIPKFHADDFVVIGTVKYVSMEELKTVSVKAALYDSSGNLIETNGVRIETLPLIPGGLSEFELNTMAVSRPVANSLIHFTTFSGDPIPARDDRSR